MEEIEGSGKQIQDLDEEETGKPFEIQVLTEDEDTKHGICKTS